MAPGNRPFVGAAMLDRLVLAGRRVSRYGRVFPLRQAARFAYRDFRGEPTVVEVSWPGYRAPFALRAGTADVRTFCHVVAADGYRQAAIVPPRVVVDAGAHIGLASVWYANRHPDARVIALEPDADNFQLLRRNTAAYPNVTPVHAALWKTSGSVLLTDPDQGSWAFRVAGDHATGTGAAPGAAVVSALCVDDLLDTYGIDRIDVFKIDIEGSEKAVFEHSATWIDRVDAIAIELHDRFQPGCSRAFYEATAGFQDETNRDEDTFVHRVAATSGHGPSAADD